MKKRKTTRESVSLGIKPDPQTTGYTCGLHTMRALYRHVRLPVRDLRTRIGVDHALPVFPGREAIEAQLEKAGIEGQGTWPFDILAVLHEDGFTVEATGDLHSFRQGLSATLADNLPGIALVDEYGHWLLVDGVGSGGYHLVDSCRSRPYMVTAATFRQRFIGGILLTDIGPPQAMSLRAYADCCKRGLAMCLPAAVPVVRRLCGAGR